MAGSTGQQSGRSPRPMAGMYRPSIKEVSPPDGQYDNQWAHFWEAIGCPEFGVLGTVPRLTSNRTALGRPVGTVQEASKKHPVDGSKLD
ncbi:hypothetical protein PCASD_06517 [Puccinia coronata f. sp. avenae]|uniref:Uncharacterized protein n=1 Tax=Puccinia coronata f. sp. avenae TaxID=200324 RepID=A0A2N5SIZ5_9BASI|nr:hypothetical protein PCASD_21150 [Puccinia coronata f. sp. avenae]PLW43980.1 hypothetical protein PCASD_06517 [Puccinia coronata f. sp. avenae]